MYDITVEITADNLAKAANKALHHHRERYEEALRGYLKTFLGRARGGFLWHRKKTEEELTSEFKWTSGSWLTGYVRRAEQLVSLSQKTEVQSIRLSQQDYSFLAEFIN